MFGEVEKELATSETFFVQVLYEKCLQKWRVFNPRKFQGLLNQSCSSFEDHQGHSFRKMNYIESYLQIQSLPSVPEAISVSHHRQSPGWGGDTILFVITISAGLLLSLLYNVLFSVGKFLIWLWGVVLQGNLSLSWKSVYGWPPYFNLAIQRDIRSTLTKLKTGSVWVSSALELSPFILVLLLRVGGEIRIWSTVLFMKL